MTDAVPPALPAIRPALASDAASVARLHIASWQASYADVLPADYLAQLDPARRTAQWQTAIAAPEVSVLVAAGGGGVDGFAASGPSRDHDLPGDRWCQLYNFHVAPDRRGHGTGGALWHATIALARRKYAGLTLWVVPANHGARRFYERHGLEADGLRRSEELGPGILLPEMRYRLTFALP